MHAAFQAEYEGSIPFTRSKTWLNRSFDLARIWRGIPAKSTSPSALPPNSMASLDERVDIDLDAHIAALPKPKRGLTALRAR